MSNSELRRINIPAGATIRVIRGDGTQAVYIFHDTDQQGGIFEDENGHRHGDVGEYRKLHIQTD